MPNQPNNRVLSRAGARELTAEEQAVVSGAGTGCITTGGIHGTASDIACDND